MSMASNTMEYYVFLSVIICFAPGSMTLVFRSEVSIGNFHTSVGKIDTTHVGGDVNCMVECFMDTTCVMVGYVPASHACQRYSVDLTGFSSGIISQPGTSFYKASCYSPGYTYVRSLPVCIKRYDTPENMTTAKAICEGEGATLLELNSTSIKNYLQDILFKIHNTDFQYLLGGYQVSGPSWAWEEAGPITDTNGGTYWGDNEPQNLNGDCMVLKSEYSNLVFAAVNCSDVNPFICANQM